MQLLRLAQLLVRPLPRVILIDEPDSSMSVEDASYVQRAIIKALTPASTVLMVTHVPYLLPEEIKIVYLKGGLVEAFGTHEELMSSSESYRDLMKELRTAVKCPYCHKPVNQCNHCGAPLGQTSSTSAPGALPPGAPPPLSGPPPGVPGPQGACRESKRRVEKCVDVRCEASSRTSGNRLHFEPAQSDQSRARQEAVLFSVRLGRNRSLTVAALLTRTPESK